MKKADTEVRQIEQQISNAQREMTQIQKKMNKKKPVVKYS